MVDNKQRIINELFSEIGDGTIPDLLNCMEAFDNLLEQGFIESFVNDKGETDYRLSTKLGAAAMDRAMNK